MPTLENQQVSLSNLMLISSIPFSSLTAEQRIGCEITEHARTLSSEIQQSASDVQLARGTVKRYIKRNKRSFSLSFQYLPNLQSMTADGRKGRDYLYELSQTRGLVYVLIKLDPNNDYESYLCYISSYNERLIRRDLSNSCSYYDISISLEEQ